jgi:metal-responsive CopG/Arc/MetJ family transcriptional regulator
VSELVRFSVSLEGDLLEEFDRYCREGKCATRHLDHDNCLEVTVLRGRPADLQRMAAALRGLKGIHPAELVLAATARTA